MSYVEQELLTLPEQLSSIRCFSGVRVARYLIICIVFCKSLFVCPFVPFLLTIVLSVLLRITTSDYLFGIFKLSIDMNMGKRDGFFSKNKCSVFKLHRVK